MAEILGEFDQPSPSPVGFCEQIPLEEYDQRSAQTTQTALHGLMHHLDANPEEYYKIIRRKKADNLKLLQFVKVKVMNKLQDDYLLKYFPEQQCQEELESLKREMASAYDYAQDGKRTGVRFSRRLAEKRKLQDPLASSTPRRRPTPTAPPLPPPPPPLPPPVSNLSTASKDFISPVTLNRLTRSHIPGTPSGTFHRQLIQAITSVSPRRKLHEINSNNSKKTGCPHSVIEQEDITAAKDSLKATRPIGSPDDQSPYQLCKARKSSEPPQDENYSLFNMELLRKFQNARSPSSSPSGNIVTSDSGFESPKN